MRGPDPAPWLGGGVFLTPGLAEDYHAVNREEHPIEGETQAAIDERTEAMARSGWACLMASREVWIGRVDWLATSLPFSPLIRASY